MPKDLTPLTALAIKNLPKGRDHAVGGTKGLYIRKLESGDQFYLQWKRNGQRTKIFLPKGLTLADARKQANVYRGQIDEGKDPKKIRKEQLKKLEQDHQSEKKLDTFGEAYKQFKQYQKNINRWESSPTGEKRQDQRTYKYLMPKFKDTRLKDIKPSDVSDVLTPLYMRSASTAEKIKAILSQVFNWAIAIDFGDLNGYTPIDKALGVLL